MNPLDGNAIAGALASFYGTDMTAAEGTCRHCGLTGLIAELSVYVAGPGSVARCPACSTVLLVVTEIRDEISVNSDGFALTAGS
jgi:hypothetical protein